MSTRDPGPDAALPVDGGSGADAGGAPGGLFQPASDATFQLQLQGELDTSVEAELYIIDLDAAAEEVAELHAQGRRTVCHFSAGSLEMFRDDAEAIPERARGNPLPAYPDERWLDIRIDEVRATMRARVVRARERGCSAILPTNLTVHLFDAGFVISEDELLAYARWLTGEARGQGLSAMLGSEQVAEALSSDFQMGLAFECLRGDGCARWAPLRAAEKPVFVVEVGTAEERDELCEKAREAGLPAIIKHREFDAFRVSCP